VFYTFLISLDCCVPLFAVFFLGCYALLQTVGELRRKQDESVELNSLSSTHLSLFGASAFLCTLNLCQVTFSSSRLRDGEAVPLWALCIFHAVVSGLAAFTLLVSLLYRLSLSPRQQRRLLTWIVGSLGQFSLVLLLLLGAAWLLTTGVSVPLAVVFFAVHPGDVGGLAVVAWVNVVIIVAATGWAAWEGLRQLDQVKEWLLEGYNRIIGEGKTTGIYTNPSRV
jgi:hypothetical protein